jgi:iron complex outermembrane recepter protein
MGRLNVRRGDIVLSGMTLASRSLVAALLAAPALAGQQRADSTRSSALPKVTVTATRSTTPILFAPLAATTVGIERLRTTGGISLADALQGIPGVLAASRSGGVDTRIAIRGFGARGAGDRSNAATMRGIRVMIDGIPETEPDGRTSLDLVDLGMMSSVDVIRSNASALWGNAAGGVIALSSVPLPGNQVDVRTMAGSFGLRRVIAQVSRGDAMSQAYVSAARTDADGWRQNSASERTSLSTGFVTPLGDRTRVAVRLMASQNNFGVPGPLTAALAAATPQAANATYNTRRERRENRIIRLGATVDRAIGTDGALSLMSYVTPKTLIRSERNTYREFDRVHGGGSLNYRQAIGDHNLIVGSDIQHQDGPARFYSLTASGDKGTTLAQDKNESATTGGVFVQDEWTAARDLTLSLGARFDGLRYALTDRVTPRLSGSRSFSQLSPKLGAVYRTSPQGMVYANFGAGVEVPANNETDPASTFGQDTVTGINPLLQPIRSFTYEVGTRQTLTATVSGVRFLRYEASVFNTEVENELVPYRGGRFYFSAGRARRQGVELGGELEMEEGWTVRSTATLMRTKYVNYTVDSVHYGRPGAIANFSGNAMVGVPRAMGMLGVRWDAFGSPLRVDAEMQYTGNYMLNDANTVELPSASVMNLSLALRRPARLFSKVGLTGFVRVENLLDRRFMTSGFLNPDVVAGQPVAFEPGLPRSVIVSFGLVHLP